MQKAIEFRLALATAGTMLMFGGTAYAQAPVGKAATAVISASQARSVMKSATPVEKRLLALPAEAQSAASAPAVGAPVIVGGGEGGKAVAAANVDVSTDSSIEPKNYGCSTATCTGTNLNTVYHYNDQRIDPSVITHDPYRRTGYFLHTFNGANFFYCSATLISRSILVMAGHCVYDTNLNKFITSGVFYPACTNCNGGGTLSEPYGHANAYWLFTTAGWAGAPSESAALDKGYDIGVVVLFKRSGTSVEIGNYTGWQGFCVTNCLQPYWQLTQYGYPSNYDGGNRMQNGEHIEKSDTRDYLLGSGMRGGSSGGPHTANPGVLSDSAVDKGRWPTRNVIFAVTSWGYTDDSFKIQGASSLSGPGNTNSAGGFKGIYNSACNRARVIHGTGSCTLLP